MMINDETKRKLDEMNLSEFIDAINTMYCIPDSYSLTFDEKMALIIDDVYQAKYNKKIKGLKRRAKLRYVEADMKDISCVERDIPHETISTLASCDYIQNKNNIILHGSCGSGKTFVACALANEAIKHNYRTLYIRMPELLERYNESKLMGKTLLSVVKKYGSYDLLVIDEWLMYPLKESDKKFMTELMEVRYDKSSTIFCSQYKPEEWYAQFGQSTLTEALIDRIFNKKISLFMGTKNFRYI